MNKQETLRIMQCGSLNEKLNFLYDLDTAFDTYNRNIANSDEVVETLITYALASKDDELTDEILEVICSAQISQDLRRVDYDAIKEKIHSVPEKFLPRYIDILGNSGNSQYLPVIIDFRNYKNKDVQESVKDALVELRASDIR